MATGVNFYLSMPENLQEGDIPYTVYVLYGWLFPLMPIALLGGVVGVAVWPEPKRARHPAMPLVPWLWPLLIPLFSIVAVTIFHILVLAGEPFDFALVLYPVLAVVALVGLMLLPLVLLRQQANRTQQAQLRSCIFPKRCLERAFGPIVGCEPKRTALQTPVF
ncbi:hypothetical protein [Deinococcus sp. QL22]|uniref:hypothetical protein n=1 Tax=Deinococcus sp. QL22 TaxID=2939437 RepID=UPI0020182E88|nr:hypothetical protein [Deinococcus sp. QL22]UQN06909.1 hypothetical protein M1R55_03050 [Deinococcus sp. QL22]